MGGWVWLNYAACCAVAVAGQCFRCCVVDDGDATRMKLYGGDPMIELSPFNGLVNNEPLIA